LDHSTFHPTAQPVERNGAVTLNDRSAHVELKRRLPSEQAEPFRPDRADHLDELARKAVRWPSAEGREKT